MCRLQITHIKIMIESMAQVPWQKIQPCPKISLVQVQTLMLLALPRKNKIKSSLQCPQKWQAEQKNL